MSSGGTPIRARESSVYTAGGISTCEYSGSRRPSNERTCKARSGDVSLTMSNSTSPPRPLLNLPIFIRHVVDSKATFEEFILE